MYEESAPPPVKRLGVGCLLVVLPLAYFLFFYIGVAFQGWVEIACGFPVVLLGLCLLLNFLLYLRNPNSSGIIKVMWVIGFIGVAVPDAADASLSIPLAYKLFFGPALFALLGIPFVIWRMFFPSTD